MSENTNLTTTITSEEYKTLLRNQGNALRLAEAVAADWIASARFSFNKPSDATLEALKRFCPEYYFETTKKVEDAEAKMNETISKAADRIINPTLPYLTPDGPGVPLREVIIGENPEATRESPVRTEGTRDRVYRN